MEVTSVIFDLAGFKITETIHYNDGIPTRTEFQFITDNGNFISRIFATWLNRTKQGKL